MATICLDNNFVSDYLASAEYTRTFLSKFGSDDDVFLPTIVWFEALTPAFRTGEGRTLSRGAPSAGSRPLTSTTTLPKRLQRSEASYLIVANRSAPQMFSSQALLDTTMRSW